MLLCALSAATRSSSPNPLRVDRRLDDDRAGGLGVALDPVEKRHRAGLTTVPGQNSMARDTGHRRSSVARCWPRSLPASAPRWTGGRVEEIDLFHQPRGRDPSARLSCGYPPLPDDVQENRVHPELYLKIYWQNQRELEQRLVRRYAAEERVAGGLSRSRGPRVTDLWLHRKDHRHL